MTHNEQHNCEANLFGGGFLSLKDMQPADLCVAALVRASVH